MNRTPIRILVLISFLIFMFSCNTLAAGEGFKTIKGELKHFGTDPHTVYYFLTNDGDKYYLASTPVLDELEKLRGYQLILTGEINEKEFTVLDYDINFDKDQSSASAGLLIGELHISKKGLYLVTKDQYVIQVYGDLLGVLAGRKVFLKGEYTKTGEYTGEIQVVSHILLQ